MKWELVAVGMTIAMLTVGLPATAQDAEPRNPVVNGEFELASPAGDVLGGTAADECIGIGHQVLYGYESPQGTVTGGPYDDPNASRADPGQAATNVTTNPEEEARFASGYDHCVWGDDTGYDLCWCNPADDVSDEAIQWSGHQDDTIADSGADDDPDREITVTKDSSSHNFWQAFPNPFQAYSGNFDAVELRVEDGQVPRSASVHVVLSASPLQAQSPWFVYYFDCSLTFTGFQTGANSIPVLDGRFSSRSSDCQQAADTWANGTDAEKREMLGRMRIVQLSFRGWDNVASTDDEVALDGISLSGATLAAEEAATGNVNPNPTSETEARE